MGEPLESSLSDGFLPGEEASGSVLLEEDGGVLLEEDGNVLLEEEGSDSLLEKGSGSGSLSFILATSLGTGTGGWPELGLACMSIGITGSLKDARGLLCLSGL